MIDWFSKLSGIQLGDNMEKNELVNLRKEFLFLKKESIKEVDQISSDVKISLK